MHLANSLVKAGEVKYGLGIGADTSQGAPGDALEYSAAAGAAAFIFGADEDLILAEVVDSYSWTTDTPDFWRREYMHYPRHGSRFTGDPAYFKHVLASAQQLMELLDTTPADYAAAVFHQPNPKFPSRAARTLGFTPEQVEKQRQAQKEVIAKSDVVITTAQVFGRKPPVLVTKDMVEGMAPGSVIVDMAAETGGSFYSVDAVEHERIYREFPKVGAIVHVHAWLEGAITTPPACLPALRARPSSLRARSMIARTSSSAS